MRADLHLHTCYSDGVHSPREVARYAFEQGVRLLAFTDHDNMEGEEEKRAAAEQYGLKRVFGMEISAYAEGKVHVLGYNCKQNKAYFDFLEQRKQGALARAQEMIEKANRRFSLSLTLDDAEGFHLKKDTPVHTMHVVKAFAKALNCEDFGALYNKYFTKGKCAYSALFRPTPFDAVELIHSLGGIASLAHPARINLTGEERISLMDSLAERGLDGIECYHSTHTEGETESFLAYAKSRNLLVTGGSDFHAAGRGRTVGLPAFEADERLLAALNLSS